MILTGAGDKAFASGTDISQFRAFKTSQDALDYEARIDRVLGALESVRVPTIAAIAGACTGGGAGIAACCDIRIGTATTRMAFRSRARWQLPVDVQHQPPRFSRRTRAHQGFDFHRRLIEAPEAGAGPAQ